MNVKELREILESYNDDMEVRIEQPTHNYWGDIMAVPLDCADTADTVYSDNIRGYKVLDYDDEVDEDDKTKEVLLLS